MRKSVRQGNQNLRKEVEQEKRRERGSNTSSQLRGLERVREEVFLWDTIVNNKTQR